MNDPSLPPITVRDLGIVLVVIAETAWNGARSIMRRLAPFMRPPSDLVVQSTKGAEYTGVLMIDDNDVVAGAVVCTGQGELPPREATQRVITTPAPDPFQREPERSLGRREGYLPGWAEDPRDVEEDDAWWPRNQRR